MGKPGPLQWTHDPATTPGGGGAPLSGGLRPRVGGEAVDPSPGGAEAQAGRKRGGPNRPAHRGKVRPDRGRGLSEAGRGLRVVLDTNVLVAAVLAKGKAHRVVVEQGFEEGRFLILTSEGQIAEFRRVMREKFSDRVRGYEVGRFLSAFREAALVLNPGPLPGLSPDPDDDLILALALEGRAHYLVTGDKGDLLALRKVKSTPIVPLSWFLKQLDPYA